MILGFFLIFTSVHSPERVWRNSPPCPSFCQSFCFFTFYGWWVPTTQERPMFLAKYTLISKLRAYHWGYCSYYVRGGMMPLNLAILSSLSVQVWRILDTQWIAIWYLSISLIFILPYNSFGTYLFALILWFFKGLLEEVVSGFKCRSAQKSKKMNGISLYIHLSISLELNTSKDLNISFGGLFYISVICF